MNQAMVGRGVVLAVVQTTQPRRQRLPQLISSSPGAGDGHVAIDRVRIEMGTRKDGHLVLYDLLLIKHGCPFEMMSYEVHYRQLQKW